MKTAKERIGKKGDEAIVRYIGPALVSCTQPLKLLFIFCNLSDAGAKALAAAVASCNCLTHLAVSCNPGITAAGYSALRKGVVDSSSPLQEVILFDGAQMNEKITIDNFQAFRRRVKGQESTSAQFRSSGVRPPNFLVRWLGIGALGSAASRAFALIKPTPLAASSVATLIQLLMGLDIDPESAKKYAAALIREGFTTPAKFALVEETDLMNCQVSRFHVRSILAAKADGTLAKLFTTQFDDVVLSARAVVVKAILQQRNKTRAVFISYHQGGAAADANMMYEYLTTKGGLDPSTVFFDKNQLQDIRQLTAEVRSSCVMIQMQSKELYSRPYTLLEAAEAFKCGVKVIPVATVSYDFGAATKFLEERDFVAALDRVNPGAAEVLCKAGADPAEVGRIVAREFPNLRSYKFHANETARVMSSQLADILDQVLSALGVPVDV
jgi:hypothetical protein